MLQLTTSTDSLFSTPRTTERHTFVFVGERLWLDFVNTELGASSAGRHEDALTEFEALVRWLEESSVFDTERCTGFRRRAQQQPSGAAAALTEAKKVRATLRLLAERGVVSERVREHVLTEINRVLGRSAGTRRVDARGDGSFVRSFVPEGDAFAGLVIPVVESAADTLVAGELTRVRRCGDHRCALVFFDTTKNGRRRWCDMATCGNRAKAARHRQKAKLKLS